MAKVERFEELTCWQNARHLANTVCDLSAAANFSRDYELRRQIRRAAGSTMHNIAEGFDCGSDAEFSRFLRMARRSASEVRSELYLALDRGYISEEQLHASYQVANDLKRLINELIGYLHRSRPTS